LCGKQKLGRSTEQLPRVLVRTLRVVWPLGNRFSFLRSANAIGCDLLSRRGGVERREHGRSVSVRALCPHRNPRGKISRGPIEMQGKNVALTTMPPGSATMSVGVPLIFIRPDSGRDITRPGRRPFSMR
jgi:hypothetical protein